MELSPVVLEPGKALAARGMAFLPSLLGALLLIVTCWPAWLVRYLDSAGRAGTRIGYS